MVLGSWQHHHWIERQILRRSHPQYHFQLIKTSLNMKTAVLPKSENNRKFRFSVSTNYPSTLNPPPMDPPQNFRQKYPFQTPGTPWTPLKAPKNVNFLLWPWVTWSFFSAETSKFLSGIFHRLSTTPKIFMQNDPWIPKLLAEKACTSLS